MLSSIIVPVAPIILGALFLGEYMQPREFLGGLVIAFALLIIDGRVLQWLRRKIGT
jgi:drug/metabolite transporter (DMT)-like permease